MLREEERIGGGSGVVVPMMMVVTAGGVRDGMAGEGGCVDHHCRRR